MKKLMIGLAAAGLCGAVFADVTSANVVGYMNHQRPAEFQNFCGGSAFVRPGADNYSLADLSVSYSDAGKTKNACRQNFIQFFTTDKAAKLDTTKRYYYYAGDWYKLGSISSMDQKQTEDQKKAISMNAGEGLICNFPDETATILYSGEVISSSTKTMTIERPEAYQNFVGSNPTPNAIDLTQISVSYSDAGKTKNACRQNFIQFFTTDKAAKLDTTKRYYYYAGDWYKLGSISSMDQKQTEDQKKAIVIAAGEGFFCNFPDETATLHLPTAL